MSPKKSIKQYTDIASELKAIHPFFKSIYRKKSLSTAEKSKITRIANKYAEIKEEFGPGGFSLLRTKKEISAAKKAKLKIGDFNFIKLNNYANEKAPLKVLDGKNVVVQRTVHKYNSHLRAWYFHKVNITYKPKSKLADKQKLKLIEAFEAELAVAKKLQRKLKAKEFSYYLWGPRGVYYRHSASSPLLLIEMLTNWVQKYVPNDAAERRARGMNNLDNVIIGFAWHANKSSFVNRPSKRAKRGKRPEGK